MGAGDCHSGWEETRREEGGDGERRRGRRPPAASALRASPSPLPFRPSSRPLPVSRCPSVRRSPLPSLVPSPTATFARRGRTALACASHAAFDRSAALPPPAVFAPPLPAPCEPALLRPRDSPTSLCPLLGPSSRPVGRLQPPPAPALGVPSVRCWPLHLPRLLASSHWPLRHSARGAPSSAAVHRCGAPPMQSRRGRGRRTGRGRYAAVSTLPRPRCSCRSAGVTHLHTPNAAAPTTLAAPRVDRSRREGERRPAAPVDTPTGLFLTYRQGRGPSTIPLQRHGHLASLALPGRGEMQRRQSLQPQQRLQAVVSNHVTATAVDFEPGRRLVFATRQLEERRGEPRACHQ